MSLGVAMAAVALILAFFPQPLLWLDGLYVSFLARSVVRATDGSLGVYEATERIRTAEAIEPKVSARLFAGLVFVGACAYGLLGGSQPLPVTILIAVLAPLTAILVTSMDRNPWYGVVGALSGAACVIAIL